MKSKSKSVKSSNLSRLRKKDVDKVNKENFYKDLEKFNIVADSICNKYKKQICGSTTIIKENGILLVRLARII